jgi:hypothetical protein
MGEGWSFTPGKSPSTHFTRGWVGPMASLDRQEKRKSLDKNSSHDCNSVPSSDSFKDSLYQCVFNFILAIEMTNLCISTDLTLYGSSIKLYTFKADYINILKNLLIM